MLVVFPPIFIADTKIIHGYNFVAPLRSSIFSLMTNVLVQSLNKIHMTYVLRNKFRTIIFHGQKALSLNYKSGRSQMFFKIDAVKNLAVFTGKHLCWSYFLI